MRGGRPRGVAAPPRCERHRLLDAPAYGRALRVETPVIIFQRRRWLQQRGAASLAGAASLMATMWLGLVGLHGPSGLPPPPNPMLGPGRALLRIYAHHPHTPLFAEGALHRLPCALSSCLAWVQTIEPAAELHFVS